VNQAAQGARSKALLLAAGLGTRLRPLTDTAPKCLVDIAGRPLLDYWFEALSEAGIRDVLVNTHHLPERVRQFLAEKNRSGFRAIEAFETELLGSAGTITANASWADDADDVLIVYADNLSNVDVSELLAAHRRYGDPVTMLLFHAPNPRACGIAELDGDGRIVAFEEKPAVPASDLANGGLYAMTAAAWREVAGMKAFDMGFDVLPRFTGRMRGHVHGGYHRDIGDLEALDAARKAAPKLFGSVSRKRGKDRR
jgi:NDP-sugar pyrophosphorylase family protein